MVVWRRCTLILIHTTIVECSALLDLYPLNRQGSDFDEPLSGCVTAATKSSSAHLGADFVSPGLGEYLIE